MKSTVGYDSVGHLPPNIIDHEIIFRIHPRFNTATGRGGASLWEQRRAILELLRRWNEFISLRSSATSRTAFGRNSANPRP